MMTIADGWETYERSVIPATAPPVHRRETRRAFYAGAWKALQVTDAAAGEGTSAAAGAAIKEGLHDELRRFLAEVTAGRA